MSFTVRNLACIVLVAMYCSVAAFATGGRFEITQARNSSTIHIQVAATGNHTLEIDDTPGFRTPIWKRSFQGSQLTFDAYETGLAPGIQYYARLDRQPTIIMLHVSVGGASQHPATCSALRSTWEIRGRAMLEEHSAVQWSTATNTWAARQNQQPEGMQLYYTQYYLLPAVEIAQACDDLSLYEELARYYSVMLTQTVTLGEAERQSVSEIARQRPLMSQRTFRAESNKIGDTELGNVQWLYPATKLLRSITLLPQNKRSNILKQFAATYSDFIVNDQLLRFLTRPVRPAPGGGPDVGRVSVWKLTMQGLKGARVWDTAMSDIDLWLLSCTAEVLGAHANDPELVPLRPEQVLELRRAIEVGVLFFRGKRTLHPDTKDFEGKTVGSTTHFNGDYDTLDEFDYSAVTGGAFPRPDQRRAIHNLPWDTCHAYRIPIFLRALFDNRKATGSDFPQLQEMRLETNQYVYRVFNGKFSRPLFRNYMDGNDTWFRVDQSRGYGYPPSEYCDMRGSDRPCMAPGQSMAWGLLSFVNPDLVKLEQALMSLAMSTDYDAKVFCDRHYSYRGPFRVVQNSSHTYYGDPLFFLVADNADLFVRDSVINVARH